MWLDTTGKFSGVLGMLDSMETFLGYIIILTRSCSPHTHTRQFVCLFVCVYVQVWDVKTMEQVAELTGHVGIIYSLQVIEAPSGGTRLFSACYDKTLRVSSVKLDMYPYP